MSRRFPPRSRANHSQRNEGTWLAMGFVLAIAGGLLALVSMVFPEIFGLVLILAGFACMLAIHYVLWGCWLSQIVAPSEETEPPPAPALKEFDGESPRHSQPEE